MLKSVFRTLVKRIKNRNIILKNGESDEFNFLKVKILLNLIQTYYF